MTFHSSGDCCCAYCGEKYWANESNADKPNSFCSDECHINWKEDVMDAQAQRNDEINSLEKFS